MTTAAPVRAESKRGGLRIPGFAQLQRLGKSLMLPIALLPAAGILLRVGQDDMLGKDSDAGLSSMKAVAEES